MCTQNYWVDIVETRDSHTYPDTPEDLRRAARMRRKAGLPKDAPVGLAWSVIQKPPSYVGRIFRRRIRSKSNQALRAAIAQGKDLDVLQIEHRSSRYFDRHWDW